MSNTKVPAYLIAIPLILVNIVAVIGQLTFIRSHLTWPLAGDICFAAALESTAIFLAAMSHAALMNGDAALRLRFTSYAFGLVIGAMNASHFIHNGHVTFAAIGLGLMSASSPFLWAIFSRRQSRDALMERGLIEGHAVRLGVNRWIFHPILSFRVFSRAVWTGENIAQNAIALLEPDKSLPELEYQPPALSDMKTLADAIRFIIRERAREQEIDISAVSAGDVAASLQSRASELQDPSWAITPGYVRDVLRRDQESKAKHARSKIRAIEPGDSRRAQLSQG